MNFQTNRLHIKPLHPTDAEDVITLLTDPQVGKTYMLPEFNSRAEAMPLFQRLMELSTSDDRYVAGIYIQDRFIGIINETDKSDGTIELGYALLPAYHNQGYATEALIGAIRFLHDQGFRTITAGAFAENIASLRVMEKAGMLPIDKQEQIEYRGTLHTCLFYAITHN